MEATTSAQDMRLLETAIGGDRSGQALSLSVNGFLSPEEAVLRLKQLLQENILDAIEERRLFFWKARRFLQKAEEDWDDRVKGAGKTALDALKMAEEFSRAIGDLDTAQVRYDERQAGDMVEAIRILAQLLAEKFEISKAEVDEFVVEAVPQAVLAIEAKTDA